jgi:hypothetical protein
MKTGPDDLGTTENESEAQNMKTGADALGIAEKESGRLTRKRHPTTSVPPKTTLEAQNMKTRPDVLGTTENEFGAQNIKMRPDSLGTTVKAFGRAKHENWTGRPPHYRKRVRERKLENGTRHRRNRRK